VLNSKLTRWRAIEESKALDSIAKRHRIVVQVFALSREMVDHIVNGVIDSLSGKN